MVHLPDGPHQFLRPSVLEQIAQCASLDGRKDLVVAGKTGQYQDAYLRLAGCDAARGFQSISNWHHQVHEDDVRPEPLHLGNCLAPISGLAHHLDVQLCGKQGADALADDGMVIGYQNANGRATLSTGHWLPSSQAFLPSSHRDSSASSDTSGCRSMLLQPRAVVQEQRERSAGPHLRTLSRRQCSPSVYQSPALLSSDKAWIFSTQEGSADRQALATILVGMPLKLRRASTTKVARRHIPAARPSFFCLSSWRFSSIMQAASGSPHVVPTSNRVRARLGSSHQNGKGSACEYQARPLDPAHGSAAGHDRAF